jgi:pimeloyl-ACP methyl ester carboxylesterase
MMPEFLATEWAARVLRVAQQDAAFRRSARSLTASLYLYDEASGTTIQFTDGSPTEILEGKGPQVDFQLGGTRAQWMKALAGAPDLPAASDPALGGLALHGDHVRLAGHARAFMRLWIAMRRTSSSATATRPSASTHVNPSESRPQTSSGPSAAEIIGRYTDVSGYRTYYESAGTGYPIVCIHSGGADGREYRHLLGHLGSIGYQAIALDMPGHGKSYLNLETLRPIGSAEEWIDFVLAFSQQLVLRQPVYVGCAMSGSLLLRLAAEHPDATAGIISANGTADFTRGETQDGLDVLNHPQVNVADYMESMTAGLLGPELPLEAQNECLWHNARNLTPEVMQADIDIYAAHDIRQQLHDITVPVLHLRGEYDRTVSEENCSAIRTGIRQVTMSQLPGVGHLPMVEDPPLFNQKVEHFLRDLPPTGSGHGPRPAR